MYVHDDSRADCRDAQAAADDVLGRARAEADTRGSRGSPEAPAEVGKGRGPGRPRRAGALPELWTYVRSGQAHEAVQVPRVQEHAPVRAAGADKEIAPPVSAFPDPDTPP